MNRLFLFLLLLLGRLAFADDIDAGQAGSGGGLFGSHWASGSSRYVVVGASIPTIDTRRNSPDIATNVSLPLIGQQQLPLPPSGLKVDTDSVIPTATIGFYPFGQKYVSVENLVGLPFFDESIKGTGFLGMGGELVNLKVLPLEFMVNFHPLPEGKISPYVGLGAIWVYTYHERVQNNFLFGKNAKAKISNPFGAVFALGADLNLTEKWFFNADFKYVCCTKFDSKITDANLAGLGFLPTEAVVRGLKLSSYVVNLGMGMRY
jgi:outer membrane protein W